MSRKIPFAQILHYNLSVSYTFFFVAETMSHNVFEVRNTQIQLMSQQNALHTFFWVLLLLVAGDMLLEANTKDDKG